MSDKVWLLYSHKKWLAEGYDDRDIIEIYGDEQGARQHARLADQWVKWLFKSIGRKRVRVPERFGEWEWEWRFDHVSLPQRSAWEQKLQAIGKSASDYADWDRSV